MKTLAVANQKGGVGKTSSLVHFAFRYAEQGLNVAFLDLDTQANASKTLNAFAHPQTDASSFYSGRVELDGLKGLTLFRATPRLVLVDKMSISDATKALRSSLSTLRSSGVDVCLIDTAPTIGVRMVSALNSSDYALSPVKLEAFSLQGIKHMEATIRQARKTNPKLRFLGLLPTMFDRRNPRHRDLHHKLQEGYSKLLIPHSIGLRSSIEEAVATGVPVWEVRKTAAKKAAREVVAVAEYLSQEMEI